MKTTGLLWFDDDPRRPVVAKIAEAVERYRERVGIEPTICEVNPAQMPATATPEPKKRQRRSQVAKQPAIVLPKKLQLVPSEQLHPNYFMLGTEGEEALIPLWRRASDDEAPAQTSHKPRLVRAPKPQAPETATPKADVGANKSPATKVQAVVKETPATKRKKDQVAAKEVPALKAKAVTREVASSTGNVVAKKTTTIEVRGVGKKTAAPKLEIVQKTPTHKAKPAKQEVSDSQANVVAEKTPAPKAAARKPLAHKDGVVARKTAASKTQARAKEISALKVMMAANKALAPESKVVVKKTTLPKREAAAKETPKPKVKVAAKEVSASKIANAAKETPATKVKAAPSKTPAAKFKARGKETVAPKANVVAKEVPASKAKAVAKRPTAPRVRGMAKKAPASRVKAVKMESAPIAAPTTPKAFPAKKPATHQAKRSA
jgi:hypothetical protein